MKKKVVVISHHRSGTHFLMKSIADHFDYIAQPYWLLDFVLGVDIWATPELERYLKQFQGKHVKNIMKSHYSVEFFDGMLDYFSHEYQLFYIIRHPQDTLASYYQFSKCLSWLEAPKVNSISEFIRAEPQGSCLRWQRKQYPSMLARWQAHVIGWLEASRYYPIHVLRYEDLVNQFNASLTNIAQRLQLPLRQINQPELTGIVPWKGGSHQEMYTNMDKQYVIDTIKPEILALWQ